MNGTAEGGRSPDRFSTASKDATQLGTSEIRAALQPWLKKAFGIESLHKDLPLCQARPERTL
jgi:hypothetical protein